MSKDCGMPLGEALDQIMRSTGCTRRQAKRKLLDALRSGQLPATGRDAATGEVVDLPAEWWQQVYEPEVDGH